MMSDYSFQQQANLAFRQANMFRQKGKMRSAVSAYEELLNICSEPTARGMLTYALGTLYWGDTGNGEKSRQMFQENVALFKKHKELQKTEKEHYWAANSCENLMLLSLSYEEYDEWAKFLKTLDPRNEILSIQMPEIHKSRERGFPWQGVMQGIMAYPLLQTATIQNPGRVVSGAAILQLILKNRKELCVPQVDWQGTVMSYSNAIVMTAESCYNKLRMSGGGMDFDEFLFIVDDAIPLVEEYVRENPKDKNVKKGLKQMKRDQKKFRKRKKSF